jgi:Uma2 family endonuclease
VVPITLQPGEYVRSRQLGEVFVAPTDCLLSDVTVVQPDVLYVATDRLSIISERGIEGAATLVVEILSPSTARFGRPQR